MAIDFATPNQKTVYERVAGILKDQFGRTARPQEATPAFTLRSGSASVCVAVAPIDERYTAIQVYSWVVTGAETTADLTRFLTEENFRLRFGGLALEPGTGDILFRHVLLGEGCDETELLFALSVVAAMADDYDDKIVQRFGGQRAIDR